MASHITVNSMMIMFMNYSRARFKLNFRDCLRSEDSMKADVIALKLRNNEQGEFWRKVNALNKKKAPLAIKHCKWL